MPAASRMPPKIMATSTGQCSPERCSCVDSYPTMREPVAASMMPASIQRWTLVWNAEVGFNG